MQRIKRTCIAFIFIFAMLAAGCGKHRYVITTAFDKTELMRINTKSCYLPEMMLYLTTIQNRYEEIYGQAIWDQSVDGISLEERLKDIALAKVAQIKVMNLLAESFELSLDEDELRAVDSAAAKFYETLNDKERELIGVNLSDIEEYYGEYALADKVYAYIIKDINPEISDDEARIVTVWNILIKTYTVDANGKRMQLSTRGMNEAYETARLVYELVNAEDASFESIAAKYSDDEELSHTIGRGEADPVFEEAAFSLDKNAISPIIETADGYNILKCVSDFDVEMTQENKETILARQREDVFNETYDRFLEGLTKTLNKKLYESISLIRDEDVTTSEFFDVNF